ncbi:MAG: glycosyltransferase family 9 protein [Gemmatimonadales bacterium]
MLLTTPLLRALRQAYPDGQITFLTKAAFAPLLAENPRLNQVLTLAPGEALGTLAARLRAGRFTHLLDLHGSLRTRMLRLLVPGRWRGYRKHRAAREILIRFKRNVYPRSIPVPERYFDAARGLGVRPDGGPPEFHLAPAARRDAAAWLEARGLGRDRPLAALAPGAAHATKQWPAAGWQVLVDRLESEGWDSVVVGGPGDREMAAAVARDRPRTAIAAGEFGLQGTGALLERARVLVSGDTGVMHMGTGVGTPVVALFGPTVREFGFFPYSPQARVIQQSLPCRPCTAWGTERCPLGHHHCMTRILPEDVLAAVRESMA